MRIICSIDRKGSEVICDYTSKRRRPRNDLQKEQRRLLARQQWTSLHDVGQCDAMLLSTLLVIGLMHFCFILLMINNSNNKDYFGNIIPRLVSSGLSQQWPHSVDAFVTTHDITRISERRIKNYQYQQQQHDQIKQQNTNCWGSGTTNDGNRCRTHSHMSSTDSDSASDLEENRRQQQRKRFNSMNQNSSIPNAMENYDEKDNTNPNHNIMMMLKMDILNHQYEQVLHRVSQLENIVSSQQVIIRKLNEQMKELSETTDAFAGLIQFLKNSGPIGSPSSSANPSSSTTNTPASSLLDLDEDDFDEDDTDRVDTDSNNHSKKSGGNDNGKTVVRETKYVEAYEDTNIFGTAPETVLEAADVAGAAILAGILAGQQRMLVDVRDAELNTSVETFVQFLELAVLPVAAGLEGLRGPRNRLKLVFPTVSELLQYRKTMCLSAPEVVALSTLGFDPVEPHDNVVVMIAPSPDDVEGLAKMNELLVIPTHDDAVTTTTATRQYSKGISKPVIVLNRHMIPITGPASKFEVAYHLRLLSVQYMSAATPLTTTVTDEDEEEATLLDIEEILADESKTQQPLFPIVYPGLQTYESIPASTTTTTTEGVVNIQHGANECNSTPNTNSTSESVVNHGTVDETFNESTSTSPSIQMLQQQQQQILLKQQKEQEERELALEAVLKKTHAAAPAGHHPLDEIIAGGDDNRTGSVQTINNNNHNDTLNTASQRSTYTENMNPIHPPSPLQGTFYGTTRAMVIRAYPHSWNVFVDTSPDDTTADFEVAAVFDNEPTTKEIHNAIITCLEGSEQEEEVVAYQMQQAYEAGQLDRISELLASILKEDSEDNNDNDKNGDHDVAKDFLSLDEQQASQVKTKRSNESASEIKSIPDLLLLDDDEDEDEDEDDDDDDDDLDDDPYEKLFGSDPD